MKIIAMISVHPGCGRTTLAVNLAAGFMRKGLRLLIAETGPGEKLRNWLGAGEIQPLTPAEQGGLDSPQFPAVQTRLGMDILQPLDFSSSRAAVSELIPALKQMNYDYLLLLPTDSADCRQAVSVADIVMACTDLSNADEVEHLKHLEKSLQTARGKACGIDIIVPNKIDTKEWEHNTEQLFALADFFGFERLADPIPG